MKKLLVPTDFSEYADAATDVACQLGRKANAEVMLLHVVEMPGGSSFNTTGQVAAGSGPTDNVYVAEMLRKSKEQMEALVNEDRFEGIQLKYHIVVGDPYHEIAKTTKENGIDLVVMGTKGATGLEEFLVGSNTEKVVRQSAAPVLTLKNKVDLGKINSIAFATGLHIENESLITHLKAFADLTGAELHVVRVNTPNNFQSDRKTHAQMEAFVKKHGLESAKLHSYSDAIEEDGIIHFAQQNSIDMIAMATHGRTGFAHLLSGSIAEDVVNHAHRPVWTYNVH